MIDPALFPPGRPDLQDPPPGTPIPTSQPAGTDPPETASAPGQDAEVQPVAKGDPPPRRRVNTLPRAKMRALEDWLASAWDVIHRTQPTQGRVAKQATVILGFQITVGNLRGAVIALGKRWPASAAAAVYCQTDQLRRGQRLLAGHLLAIIERLGLQPPADLIGLARQTAPDTPSQPTTDH